MKKTRKSVRRTKQQVNGTIQNPTLEYGCFDQAFDFFNATLFGGELPRCLITLHRHPRARGYFSHKKFEARALDAATDEIALNPDAFQGRTDADILSTLVHEMAHNWQFHFGKPSRGRYHNQEWANKMEEIGLMPSATGAPGGRRTGQSMTHYVIEGGPFDLACRKLLAGGFKLTWQSVHTCKHGPKSKVKYTCPGCGLNAWAKPSAPLVCGDCAMPMGPEDA